MALNKDNCSIFYKQYFLFEVSSDVEQSNFCESQQYYQIIINDKGATFFVQRIMLTKQLSREVFSRQKVL